MEWHTFWTIVAQLLIGGVIGFGPIWILADAIGYAFRSGWDRAGVKARKSTSDSSV